MDAASELRKFTKGRAAKADAVDARLQEVTDGWDGLPEAIRDAICLIAAASAKLEPVSARAPTAHFKEGRYSTRIAPTREEALQPLGADEFHSR